MRFLAPSLILVLALGSATRTIAQLPEQETAHGSPQGLGLKEPGLLFYLSGDHGFQPDYAAGGQMEPNFLKDVKVLPNGSKGSYLQCGNGQMLSYWAPGNIYSQRGTLAFDWRSREPVDATEFPIFRVGYGDHSSWDMVWLRIDYNGHGFDAFVTDVNLGRTRVSYTMPNFPKPSEWVHLALAWDENTGIRFYVNGKLVAAKAATGPFDATLDQFGPHSRIIAPTGVESTYNYARGGDIDELRIYDRMLNDDNIAALARDESAGPMPPLPAQAANAERQTEWWTRYGWNIANHPPAMLPNPQTTVRKVEIHDAYDLKRWWWRGTDGIPETTWPGVYNRSSLTGRFDYFQLPDWDCYSLSGKSVTFYLPAEPWNHLEVISGAKGRFDLLTPGQGQPGAVADPDQHDPSPMLAKELFTKGRDTQRLSFDLATPVEGEKVRFTNVDQEWPIEEFEAYYVHAGAEPTGHPVLRYTVTARGGFDNPSLQPLENFIHGRHPAGERSSMVAYPVALGRPPKVSVAAAQNASEPASPLVHILLPADFRGVQADTGHGSTYSWENMHAGLDGIAIDLPALHLKPTHGDLIPMNIRIKDPIWPMRNMLDFSFSIKPGEAHTLWLDTRDRILPNGKSLYLTIASASPEFNTASLEGMQLRLVFKPYNDALPEHIADRLTQTRDVYSNLVEESVNSRKLNIFNQFDGDVSDLLRVDPENDLGRKYWNEANHEQNRPPFTPPVTPEGTPQWAFLQLEDLRQLKSLINWYVDNRQISNGEFGGGLSDDSDFLNMWPGLAMMGSDPDKLKASLLKTLEVMYDTHMFTNGLATAQYDELHSYEDGINVLGQSLMLDYGSPRLLERAMETSKRLEWLTGMNVAGQRQPRSQYYSGTKMAENGVWAWTTDRSFMVFHPALALVSFNGTPRTRTIVEQTAEGLLAHRHTDADGKMRMHLAVNFKTNEDLPSANLTPWFMLWASYKWTGDNKYLAPFGDDGPTALRIINADAMDVLHVRDTWGKQLLASSAPERRTDAGVASETNEHLTWQLTGDKSHLVNLYKSQLQTDSERSFINREGSLWIDRIYISSAELQRARLGGVALVRNSVYPGNVVSWRFADPKGDEKVAILVPEGAPDHIRITAYNVDSKPMQAEMTGWEINPGDWEITQSTQATENGPLSNTATRTASFERSTSLPVTFAPNTMTVLDLKLTTPGVPYWSRPDLGLDPKDVVIDHAAIKVTVHSVGAVASPAAKVVVRDSSGKIRGTGSVPPLEAPSDLIPKTKTVTVSWDGKGQLKGGTVTIETPGSLPEITQRNNTAQIP